MLSSLSIAIFVYISQKIRVCKGDFEGNFHTSVPASIFWKFRSIIHIFLLFFAGVVKSTAFCTLLLLFQWLDIFKLQFDAKMWLKHFNLFEIAVIVFKKQWIWQLLQKIEEKWVYWAWIFRSKSSWYYLAFMLVLNLPSKSPLQSLIVCEMLATWKSFFLVIRAGLTVLKVA